MEQSTSWQKVSDWYNQKQGLGGSYYYQNIILPKTIQLLDLESTDNLLDLGCGQGILERLVSKKTDYLGIDLANNLIKFARIHSQSKNHQFIVGDVTKPLPISTRVAFEKIAVVLVLQNLAQPQGLITNIRRFLSKTGRAVIVLNHPYFRIPRQSRWEIDQNNKIQYRRVDRYQHSLSIPIVMNPGQAKPDKITWSFHYPLWFISQLLSESNLVIEKIEEWISDKHSVGKVAKMENLARREFPLFMALKIACQD